MNGEQSKDPAQPPPPAMSEPAALLAIAHITRPHGVRGEVSAIPLVPPVVAPDDVLGRRLFARTAEGAVSEIEVLGWRPHQDRWLLTVAGIESMTDADTLREIDLCLPRAELPVLPEGWYYEADLEGCTVVDKTLGDLGDLVGVDLGLVQARMKLRRPGGAIVLVPWVDAFVKEVDLAARRISVDLPPGVPGISD